MFYLEYKDPTLINRFGLNKLFLAYNEIVLVHRETSKSVPGKDMGRTDNFHILEIVDWGTGLN